MQRKENRPILFWFVLNRFFIIFFFFQNSIFHLSILDSFQFDLKGGTEAWENALLQLVGSGPPDLYAPCRVCGEHGRRAALFADARLHVAPLDRDSSAF